ncbi:hypothetical protein ACIQAA_27055 [Neobacillus sp. NPDC093182]|uniref:hypothetical protein n=1 Tax=Neobacillus sp. NPDC093182 TaxID=3364297 RepID=UPI0037F4EA67
MANIKGESFFSLLKMPSLWRMATAKLLMIPLLLNPFLALSIPFPLVVIAGLVSGMPSAPTISLYGQKYGADSFFASIGVLVTTVLCMMTIPFLYFILNLISQFIRG